MTVVHVPPGEATEVARRLLAAAQELKLPASVVATSSDGIFGFSFVVPDAVHHLAYGIDGVIPPVIHAPSEVIEAMVAAEEPIDLELEPQPAPKKRGRPRKAVLAESEEHQ